MSKIMKGFDTYRYIKELQATGMQESQAEIIMRSIFNAREFDISMLATKEQSVAVDRKIDSLEKFTKEQFAAADRKIDSLEKKLDDFVTKDQLAAEISKVQASIFETKTLIAEAQTTMIKWMVGTMVALSGIILTAMKFFF